MENKYIYCVSCNLYLGEIRDATLRIGLVYLCKHCFKKWKAANSLKETTTNKNDLPDFFKDLFK